MNALKHGRTIDYFLEQFPSVTGDRIERLLDDAQARVASERVPA